MSGQHTPGQLVRKDTPDYAELFATDPRAGSLTHHIAMVGRAEDADRLALCWNTHDELVEHAKAQHAAIDTLMARLIALDPNFRPTKWAHWPSVAAHVEVIAKATGNAHG